MAERWGRGRGREVRGGGRGRATRGRGGSGRGRKPKGRGQNGRNRDAGAVQSRQPTLLRKLLRKEQRRECSLVLQLFRHLVQTDFFSKPLQDDRQWDDDDGDDGDEDEQTEPGEVGPARVSQLPPAEALVPAYQAMLAAVGLEDDADDDDATNDDGGDDGTDPVLGDIPTAEEAPSSGECCDRTEAASSNSAE